MNTDGHDRSIPVPPPDLRWGGAKLDDDAYRTAARGMVRMLSRRTGLQYSSRVLDVGCGQGKLAIGLLSAGMEVAQYVGLDVHARSLEWAQAHLTPLNRAIRFELLPIGNERYNPAGQHIGDRAFPVPSAETDHNGFDTICLNSVFSHMRLADIDKYLHEIRRVLAPQGKAYVTAYVEVGVPDEEENPPNYWLDWCGALHGVRLNRHRFEELAFIAGLRVSTFAYCDTRDGQSSYVLERNDVSVRR